MGRSGYTESCEGWELIRWRGAVTSAIRGKRGQKFLAKLLAALDAMPEKRLIEEELEQDGEVCALGCIGKAAGLDLSTFDPEEHERLGLAFDISPKLIQEIEYINDESGGWPATPEKRFEDVRKWVLSQLATSTAEQFGQATP